jgi:hypothetical protein
MDSQPIVKLRVPAETESGFVVIEATPEEVVTLAEAYLRTLMHATGAGAAALRALIADELAAREQEERWDGVQ